jgi:hypothetical protein
MVDFPVPQGATAPNRKIPHPQRLRSRWKHFFWIISRDEFSWGCRQKRVVRAILFGTVANEHANSESWMLICILVREHCTFGCPFVLGNNGVGLLLPNDAKRQKSALFAIADIDYNSSFLNSVGKDSPWHGSGVLS